MSKKSINHVAVVIPNLNGEPYVKEAVNSLLIQSHPCTIIVVDNGSTDTSVQSLRDYNGKITLLLHEKNLGFTGGVNAGIKWALDHSFDAIALFNNDAVADKNWLQELVELINNDNSVSIATGLLAHQNNQTIDSTGEQYSVWGLPFPRNRNDPLKQKPAQGYVFAATGGATLYRSSLFREIGLFDDAFFAYYEDVDISFRAQLHGHKVAYTPSAIAYHKQGATSAKIPGFTVRQTFKNLPLLFWKNVPLGLLLPIGLRFFFAYALMFGNTFKHGSSGAALRGLYESVTLLPSALRDRRAIQYNRKVSVDYIKSILWLDLPPDQTGLRKLRRVFMGRR